MQDMNNVGKKQVDVVKLSEQVRKLVPSNDPAYLAWAKSKTADLFDQPTITVRGKQVAPTLENIVDAMTAGGVAGAEKTMTSGVGKVSAMLGKRFKSLAELLAFARSNPGKLNIGSINIGSTQNLAAELFKSTAAMDVQIVPFNGTPAVVTALRGGQIDAAVEILGPVMSQVQAKALRVLAVTGEKRSAALPDVPTARESGLSSFVAASWNGLAAPARTPKPVIERLNREVVAAINHPDVRRRLAELNVDAQASSPEQASALLASEVKRWGEVIVRARIPQQ
jgi:tripartite-type tricarboxylate transporter receptor subunit TctC